MIHYHGAPVSGPQDQAHRFYTGRHVMVSFADPSCLDVVADVCSTFSLDNGAFSTWKRGAVFDTDRYYKWVEGWRKHPRFDWAVVPDVIGGTERENNKLIDQWPFHRWEGMPVYHFHERPYKLGFLLNWWGRAALGSSGKWPNPGADDWWDRVEHIMKFCCSGDGLPWGKLHGLRMLDPDIFTRLPLHSADSCNAAINAGSVKRFGIYPHPLASGRASVIADRIESFQSADCWQARPKEGSIFDLQVLTKGAT